MDRMERLVVAEASDEELDCSDLTPDDWVAVQALLELGHSRDVDFPLWGRTQKRSGMVSSNCKFEDEEEKRMSALPAEENRRIVPAAAVAKPQQMSPKTPLRWSGDETVSASPNSDSANSQAAGQAPSPCDFRLGPKLKTKVERKLEVHNPSNRKGPKKKTLAELKELVNDLLSDNEEMKKEKEKMFNRLQSLRARNKHLNGKLALTLPEKGEDQLPTQSPAISSDLEPLKPSIGHDVSESSQNLAEKLSSVTAMDWNSSVERISPSNQMSCVGKSLRQDSLVPTKSSSRAFVVPDLNIPFQEDGDLSDNMLNNNDNQVVEANNKAVVAAEAYNKAVVASEANNKAVVAAEARKYRKECLRLKHSQSVKAQLRWH